MESFLALADADLPDPVSRILAGPAPRTGRLTAEEVLRTWNLNADLATLSACQTALGKYERGEGYVGFAQALFLAGARSLVLSQWSVDDEATALLMVRFYQNLLGKRGLKAPMPKAEALREAKEWLRQLTRAGAGQELARLPQVRGAIRSKAAAPRGEDGSYAHPYYWSGFILIGDPE